ncbi:unnamed protein product [Phytophthora fragariaefolia]|uniref:Unnamed protein product n=1 Tax=Phytophthora fragariaefolia TaxID=1490495 RepID=A0A9W7D553_9STRA|nr:unnamed protein product [Phytophthora fragariaefolia]
MTAYEGPTSQLEISLMTARNDPKPSHKKTVILQEADRTARTPGQNQGRTRKSGKGKPRKKLKRVAVTYRFKLDVLKFYDEPNSIDITVKKFFPTLSLALQRVKKRQIYSWLKQRDFIVAMCANGGATHLNAREAGISRLCLHRKKLRQCWKNQGYTQGVKPTSGFTAGDLVLWLVLGFYDQQPMKCYVQRKLPSLQEFSDRSKLNLSWAFAVPACALPSST